MVMLEMGFCGCAVLDEALLACRRRDIPYYTMAAAAWGFGRHRSESWRAIPFGGVSILAHLWGLRAGMWFAAVIASGLVLACFDNPDFPLTCTSTKEKSLSCPVKLFRIGKASAQLPGCTVGADALYEVIFNSRRRMLVIGWAAPSTRPYKAAKLLPRERDRFLSGSHPRGNPFLTSPSPAFHFHSGLYF